MSWADRLTDPATLTALAGLITAATALVTAWRNSSAIATANLRLDGHLKRLDGQSKRLTLLECPPDDDRAVTVDESRRSGGNDGT